MTMAYRYLVAAVASLALLISAFGLGVKVGNEHQIAKRASEAELIAAVEQRTQLVVAEAIAKMKPTHQITKQVLEREIRIVPDYSRCVNSADGLRAINGALTNEPVTPGDRGMSNVDANGR